jgi:hypothetical protein
MRRIIMEFIKGRCWTNLDGYQGISWPTLFYKVPEKGDRVMSKCGERSLKVYGITHCPPYNYDGNDDDVSIRIELHR